MIDLDEKFGFVRWRVAALILNLLANGIALYAAVRFIRRGTHGSMLAIGLGISVLCIALLARPDTRPPEDEERDTAGSATEAEEA